MSTRVVLLPGFNGAAEQPILVSLAARLEQSGFACTRLAPPRLKLDEQLSAHVAWLREATAAMPSPLVLVGRSFGGRLAIRLAGERQLAAVVLLGFPIRPPGKKRLLDEQALAALRVPTLIVQGTKDQLGPLRFIKPMLAENPRLTLHEVAGAGHGFGAREPAALDFAARWLTTL